ncbi:hypothetical protein PUNSTDRAFT_143134 [Punctularia strigosozonata HHB-11173 SS5]|uniref:uncharacterized protein n=1 Tax=Punctularia strigosozonata (strain HHB-11173) TaxID=741275 RepID=UPI0004417A84|nr:uncharacterized protein PUNSTDRAFT_143134 [Punctularia strigosozonata HHB-11173 SS5]EIN09643.1 hypothetical protein PUNSTDRAFT_143134 [Punctularia strigosozonata HHB-11173 SS5]
MSGLPPQPPPPPSEPSQTALTTPATDALLEPLNDLQSLAHTLFASLSPAHTKPPPAPPLTAFLDADARLADAVALARVHQARQRRIEALKADIGRLDARWRDICAELERGRRELEAAIEEGEVRVRAMQKAKDAAVPYPELLSYAQAISAFTSAPPNMPALAPGQPPPPLFFPPFPNEEKMRRGRMNAEAPLGILGETHSVGRPPTASPPKQADQLPAMGHGANPYRPEQRPPQQVFDLDLDLNPDL